MAKKETVSKNPWDRVKLIHGKLVGKLTDTLALASLPNNRGYSQASVGDVARTIGSHKVYKGSPSKFKTSIK